ncbi:hypothetical protein HKX48_008335 [Thoreauomyces humboldtii]|nr:hypothetical protein HKX48_008335 [Thoreauomyces humboldtii]
MPTSRTKDSPGDASPPPAALQHLHLFITPEPVPLDLQSVLTEPLFDATIRAGARDRPDAINKTIHALRNAAIVWKADSTEWSELVAVLNCIGFPMATSPRASPSPPLTSADLTAAESHPEAHTVALQEIAAYAHRSTRRLSELLFAMLYVRGRVLTNAYRTKSMTQQADAAQIVSLKAEVERLRRKVLERGSKSDDDRRRRVVAEGYLKDMQDLTINEIALRKSARPTDLTRPRIHPTLPRPVSESFLRREFVKDVGTGSTSFEIQRTPSVTEAFAESTSPRGGDGAGAGRLPVRRSIFRKSSEEARPRQGSEPEPSVLDDLHFRGLAAKMELGRLKAVENSAGGLSEVTLSPSSTGSDTNTHSSSGGSDVVTNKSAGSSGCSTSGSAKQPAEKSGRFSFSFLSGRTRPTQIIGNAHGNPATVGERETF